MMGEKEILGHVSGLRRKTLNVWIKRGWVIPKCNPDGYQFREIDIARVLLIHEFSTDLNLGEDALEVVLPLLDQVHGLRHQLRCLARAIGTLPEESRQHIATYLEK